MTITPDQIVAAGTALPLADSKVQEALRALGQDSSWRSQDTRWLEFKAWATSVAPEFEEVEKFLLGPTVAWPAPGDDPIEFCAGFKTLMGQLYPDVTVTPVWEAVPGWQDTKSWADGWWARKDSSGYLYQYSPTQPSPDLPGVWRIEAPTRKETADPVAVQAYQQWLTEAIAFLREHGGEEARDITDEELIALLEEFDPNQAP